MRQHYVKRLRRTTCHLLLLQVRRLLRGQHNVLRLLLLLLLMRMSLLNAWLVSKLPLLRRLEGRSVLMRLLLLLLRKVRGLLLAHPRSKLLLRRLPSGSRRVDELNRAARPSSHRWLLLRLMLVVHGLLWLGRLVLCAGEVLLLVRVRRRRGNVPTSTVLLLIVGVDLLRMLCLWK